MSNYRPVNCEFHDVIEACAILQKSTTILARNADGTHRFIHAIISDIFARDGAEYLETQCGQLIRLDELLAIDDQDVSNYVREF